MSLHFKSNGSLDMHYKSSVEIAKWTAQLDMSSSSSRQTKESVAKKQSQGMGIPSYVPVTDIGHPDLRTNAAKDWVQSQARTWNDSEPLLAWIPRLKDGSPDTIKSATRQLFSNATPPPEPRRDDYYAERLMDMFQRIMEMQRAQEVPRVHEPEQLHDTATLRTVFDQMYNDGDDSHHHSGAESTGNASADTDVFPPNAEQYEYMRDLVINDNEPLFGHGSFGVVLRGMLYGVMDVAIKKLHAS